MGSLANSESGAAHEKQCIGVTLIGPAGTEITTCFMEVVKVWKGDDGESVYEGFVFKIFGSNKVVCWDRVPEGQTRDILAFARSLTTAIEKDALNGLR